MTLVRAAGHLALSKSGAPSNSFKNKLFLSICYLKYWSLYKFLSKYTLKY